MERKLRISFRHFERSLQSFVIKRATTQYCAQADINSDAWEQWPVCFEPDEVGTEDALLKLSKLLIARYKKSPFKNKSNVVIPIYWDIDDLYKGMPETLYLQYFFSKNEENQEYLEFKLFLKRNQCRKKRIARMKILLKNH